MKRRCVALLLGFLVIMTALFVRLVYVQFLFPRDLEGSARSQSERVIRIPPYRGKILDRRGQPLALDVRRDSLGVRPPDITSQSSLAHELKKILRLDTDYLDDRLSRDKKFVWIARQISPEQSRKIKALGRDELELRPEWKRIYPNRHSASHLIGFTGIDHVGLEGIEAMFDSHLKGVPGWKFTKVDAKRREVVAKKTEEVAPINGFDVQLTLDAVVQYWVDESLEATCKRYQANAGTVVVMDPRSGDILAMANYPFLNPHQIGKANPEHIRNRSVTDMYEPGSVFKVFTLAAVLEEGIVDLNDVIYCEEGAYRTGGRILHDVHPYGDLTLKEVINKSSNIGTVKTAHKLGSNSLHRYIKQFGFGDQTGIQLAGESSGRVYHPRSWSATSISSMAIGQEVGVTALQLAVAFSSFVNEGFLLKPRIVSQIKNAEGKILKSYPPKTRRRVMSKETAAKVKEVLESVVTEGTGTRAKVKGGVAGGKTGTSQKLEPDGSYSHRHFIASFAGFVHNDKELAVIVVSIDDPQPYYYGGIVAAPLFAKVAQGLLDYWEAGDPG
jgi:cell division protein FtsI (penicillin-binding protein 3)